MLKFGDRVRLKAGVRLPSGWRGNATYLRDGIALKDGCAPDDGCPTAEACDWQWSRLRDQSPNQRHEEALEWWRHADPLLAAGMDLAGNDIGTKAVNRAVNRVLDWPPGWT